MNLCRLLLSSLLLCVLAAPSAAEIKHAAIEYEHAGDLLEGHLYWDDAAANAKKPAPGIVVCPEWWGTNDYPRQRAKELAKLGYVAFAIDMYGKGVTTDDASVAEKLSGAVMGDLEYLRARARAGYDALAARPEVDKAHIAAIGYCMGGNVALELARSGAPLDALVVFHPGAPAARGDETQALADNKKIRGFLTVCYGLADPFTPPAEIDKFNAQMTAAGVDYQIVGYAGAKHAFTNAGADRHGIEGVAYDAKADARSFELMKSALAAALVRR